jgi:prepilin-type N-terminal cleavage/methylation domain-containing protein
MRSRARNDLGMTLVELMIVVVIIGILAAIAVVGYSKYRKNARVSEATAMLAEFVAKEQLFFLDSGEYMEAHCVLPDCENDPVFPSQTENAADFWPHDPSVDWDSGSEFTSIYTSTGKIPKAWRRLGIRARWNQLYCTYLVNAGCARGSDTSGRCDTLPGTVGQGVFGSTVPNVPWFYAIGVCNLVGRAGWPGGVTMLTLTHNSTALVRTDETR